VQEKKRWRNGEDKSCHKWENTLEKWSRLRWQTACIHIVWRWWQLQYKPCVVLQNTQFQGLLYAASVCRECSLHSACAFPSFTGNIRKENCIKQHFLYYTTCSGIVIRLALYIRIHYCAIAHSQVSCLSSKAGKKILTYCIFIWGHIYFYLQIYWKCSRDNSEHKYTVYPV